MSEADLHGPRARRGAELGRAAEAPDTSMLIVDFHVEGGGEGLYVFVHNTDHGGPRPVFVPSLG